MASPVKDTPVLSGKDAEKFAESMRKPGPLTFDEYERIRRAWREITVVETSIREPSMSTTPTHDPNESRNLALVVGMVVIALALVFVEAPSSSTNIISLIVGAMAGALVPRKSLR